ncbi:NAD(P)-binding protein [Byssothecium circinans]|uniref:NAD(P)-binding protein n=1 Tax=Byssothecium circinans TaxID=147558 RepID=A0A6A5TQ40_9PLEO|nr:NAD(P)-binding protein [Byssothecium circinans]
MASHPKSVFLVGPGFVGLPIIGLLLAANYQVTTMVRNKDQAAALEKKGVKTLHGTLDDHDLLTAQAAQHAITINTASSDHVPSTLAINAGLRQRVAKSLPTILIHTSGTGVLVDNAKGAYKTDRVYRDDNPAEIDALPDTAFHRDVDLEIVKAAKEFGDKAKLAIILPPTIHGFNPENKRLSMAVPKMMRFALKHGFTGHIGAGANIWNTVHVNDLARAYSLLLSDLTSPSPSLNVLENPYFFTEDGYIYSWKEVAERIGNVLFRLGKIESPGPRVLSEEHYADLLGPITEMALGSNSICRAVRLRKLGWVPREKGIWKSFEEDEVEYLISSYEAEGK